MGDTMSLIFGDLVKQRREEMKLSQDEAAKTIKTKYDVSISGSYLSMIERNGRTNLTINVVNAIIDFFNLPASSIASLFTKGLDIAVKVPLLGPIKAGVPILSTDNYTETIEPPEGVVADFAAPVEGDSMVYAGIHPGDIAFFRECKEPKPGYIVAARVLDYEAAVNLKFFVQKNGQAVLRSANPDYKDIPFTKNYAVVGIMTGLIRDGSPVLRDYESIIYSKERLDEKWNKAVFQAMADGITPEQFTSLVSMMKKFLKGE
ncbi:helix-turn-helix domain-containing protein [Sporomusa sphaeroides]|uniref:helix-turn-helix domain-containing protein n=1 Tax=Sporomusa sphaeroides TaxID=47679 RepID=UPI003D9FD69B